MFGSH